MATTGVVAVGTLLGRRLIGVISQEVFEVLVLVFTFLASVRLIVGI